MTKAIITKKITKTYKLYNGAKDRLLDTITPKNYGGVFYALTEVDFQAERGDVIGFVGINGSGKSTLSNIIAGVVPETSGSVQVNGEVALIAVAAGLKNDLTGRDNIELKCLMLGFSKEQIKKLEPAIIEFSELGQFIDQPVKSYSSGMKSRLGFAISVNVDPDILIIDEALSVGDKAFAAKSLDKMKEFKKQGKTMIFVSHSINQMKTFCDKILWLEFGKVKDYGLVEKVIPRYEAFLQQWKKMTNAERKAYRDGAFTETFDDAEEDLSMPYNKTYIEQLESRIAQFKPNEKALIYAHPNQPNERESSRAFEHATYYVKRKAVYNNELFYLLSDLPSATDGVIGWVEVTRLKSYRHMLIDKDAKTFYLTGDGKAFDRPWGNQHNCVVTDLKPYMNQVFRVNRTDMIGKDHAWYRGDLNGEHVWISGKFLQVVDPMKTQDD